MYTYDDAGNLLTKKEYALTAANATPTTLYSTVTYGYNDADWGDLLTSYGGDSITYDEIGNPIKIENPNNYGNEIFMEWDGRELTQYYVSSIVPYNICTYTYNDEGIRTSKTVDGVTHYYYLSGSQIIAEEWNNILCLYLYDADGSPIGMQYRTTSMAEGSFYTYWFEKNLQGDIVAVYSDSGVKLRTYTYDAWGNVTETTVNQSGTNYYARYNPFRYRGYYYDTETDLYYLQSRYYNPEWGRFLNADGYISTGTGLLGYNMFAYCNNNPVMFIDPSGDLLFTLIFGGVLLVGLSVGLTGCSPTSSGVSSSNAMEELDQKHMNPGAYTTEDEALEAAFNKVYDTAKRNNFDYEYGIFVYQKNGYYYCSSVYNSHHTHHLGKEEAARKILIDPSIVDSKNRYPICAFIHTHPYHNDNILWNEDELNNVVTYYQYIIDVGGCRYRIAPGVTSPLGYEYNHKGSCRQ